MCKCQNEVLQIFQPLYEKLLQADDRGTPIWKRVAAKELALTPHFCGEAYETSRARLLLVGRAVNGWEYDYSICGSASEMAQTALTQRNPLEDVVKMDGFEASGRKRNYLYCRSNFWKLVKLVLAEFGEADTGITRASWLGADHPDWNQKIAWSNLYKLAPFAAGNPDWRLIKPHIEDYVSLIQAELDFYTPRYVLFVTDMGYFKPWVRKKSFADILDRFDRTENGCIAGSGYYHESKILVCTRPDRWGITNEQIGVMAKEIKTAFDVL